MPNQTQASSTTDPRLLPVLDELDLDAELPTEDADAIRQSFVSRGMRVPECLDRRSDERDPNWRNREH